MFKLLEPVVLKTNLADHGLRKGLLGTVVEVHSPAKVEVEFVAANGRTIALLPLKTRDLRKATDADALAVAPAMKRGADVIGPFNARTSSKRAARTKSGKRREIDRPRSKAGTTRRRA